MPTVNTFTPPAAGFGAGVGVGAGAGAGVTTTGVAWVGSSFDPQPYKRAPVLADSEPFMKRRRLYIKA